MLIPPPVLECFLNHFTTRKHENILKYRRIFSFSREQRKCKALNYFSYCLRVSWLQWELAQEPRKPGTFKTRCKAFCPLEEALNEVKDGLTLQFPRQLRRSRLLRGPARFYGLLQFAGLNRRLKYEELNFSWTKGRNVNEPVLHVQGW